MAERWEKALANPQLSGCLALRRVRFGPLALGALRPGQWRELTQDEVQKLYAL